MKLSTILPLSILLSLTTACGSKTDPGAASLDAVEFAESRAVDFDHLEDDEIVAPSDSASADSTKKAEDEKPPTSTVTERSDVKTANDAHRFMNASPDSAKYAAGILHRIATDNPSYASRLLNNPMDYFVVVDKQSMNVVLYDRYGREKKSYGMACARNYGTKHGRSDCRTPEGFFSAEGIYDSTDWLYTDDNGYTSPTRGVYGTRFIRVKNPVTNSIGIHGTNSPGSIGRRTSHGCIRLNNASIVDLVKYVRPGMPIIVNPSDRDQQVNRREGYKVVQINIGKGTAKNAAAAQTAPDTVASKPATTPTDSVASTAPTTTTPTPASTSVPADTTSAQQSLPEAFD